MSSTLRVLLDESITDPLAAEMSEVSGLNVECCRHLSIKGCSDESVIEYAKREERIVITTETGMNDKSFPICTHPGIIVMAGRKRHESVHIKNFMRFMLSGHRKEARDAVTFISEHQVRVKNHDGERNFPI